MQARHVLQQKWVVMAGDSITRFLFAALLRLLADDGEFAKLECKAPVAQRTNVYTMSIVAT